MYPSYECFLFNKINTSTHLPGANIHFTWRRRFLRRIIWRQEQVDASPPVHIYSYIHGNKDIGLRGDADDLENWEGIRTDLCVVYIHTYSCSGFDSSSIREMLPVERKQGWTTPSAADKLDKRDKVLKQRARNDLKVKKTNRRHLHVELLISRIRSAG